MSFKPSEYQPNWAAFDKTPGRWILDLEEEKLDRIKRTPPVAFECHSYRSVKEVASFVPQNLFFRQNTVADGPAHECYDDFYNEDEYPKYIEDPKALDKVVERLGCAVCRPKQCTCGSAMMDALANKD